MPWTGRLLLACLLTAGGAAAAAASAPAPAPMLSLEHYDLDSGLSQLSINAMSGDDRGFLWVATQEGLNRFDGHRFNAYRRSPDPQHRAPGDLLSSSIESLAFDPERGLMWLGSNDAGAEVLHLPSWKRWRLTPDQGLSHTRVTRVLVDPAGGAWLGTQAGIDHVDATMGRARNLGRTAPIVGLAWSAARRQPVALDARCRLWAVGGERLDPIPGDHGQDCIALQAGDEGLWLATRRDGLRLLDDQGRSRRAIAAAALAPAEAELTALARTRDERILAGFSDGTVAEVAAVGTAPPRRLRFDRPPDSAITQLYQGRSGSLWIGTYTSGLYRVRPLSTAIRHDLDTIGAAPTWPSRSLRAIWRQGPRLLIGTDNGLMARDGAEAPWRAVAPFNGRSVRAVAAANEGGWWIGTQSGLWRLHADGRTQAIEGLPDPRIDHLLVEDDGVWVGTRGGPARLRHGRPVDEPALRPLRGQWVTSLLRTADGTLWLATNASGLWRLPPGGVAEPYEPVGAGLHKSIWPLHADGATLWAGSFSGGLFRIDLEQGRSTAITDRDGLSNNVVYALLPDHAGRLWMSTNNGLSVLDPASGIVQNVGRRDGLRNQEYNSSSSYRDQDGLLYFGGTQGLDMIDPRGLEAHSAPAQPVLTALRVLSRIRDNGPDADVDADAETDLVYAEHIVLEPRDTVFSIAMTAIDFTAPAAARLRYRVHGLHEGWVYPHAARTEFSVSNLDPGRYRLEVQAAGRDGRYGESRVLAITMRPPAWRHPLAYAGYALLLLALGAWLALRVRWAVHRERAQVELLNRTVAERTAQLEQANRQLMQSIAQLDVATRLDPLTRVSNRRDLQDWLQRASGALRGQAAAAPGRHLVFFMIDIDNFKRVNDQYGHHAGDQVLVQFADRLRLLARESDLVVRWGGEEFLLVAWLSRDEDAAALAERIRDAIAATLLELEQGHALPLTCSVGFAPWPFSTQWPALGDWEQSVELADRCMYAAKAAGKNAWVGLVPDSGLDRDSLMALLAGAMPAALPAPAVRVLHSTVETPAFVR